MSYNQIAPGNAASTQKELINETLFDSIEKLELFSCLSAISTYSGVPVLFDNAELLDNSESFDNPVQVEQQI